jgi:hypothetical protein
MTVAVLYVVYSTRKPSQQYMSPASGEEGTNKNESTLQGKQLFHGMEQEQDIGIV